MTTESRDDQPLIHDWDDPTEKPNWKDKLLNWAFKSWNGGLSSEQNDRYDQYAEIAAKKAADIADYEAKIARDIAAYDEWLAARHRSPPPGHIVPDMDPPFGYPDPVVIDPPFGFIPEDLDDPELKNPWPDKLLNWTSDSLIGRCCLFAVCFIVGCALALPALLIVLWLWK